MNTHMHMYVRVYMYMYAHLMDVYKSKGLSESSFTIEISTLALRFQSKLLRACGALQAAASIHFSETYKKIG